MAQHRGMHNMLSMPYKTLDAELCLWHSWTVSNGMDCVEPMPQGSSLVVDTVLHLMIILLQARDIHLFEQCHSCVYSELSYNVYKNVWTQMFVVYVQWQYHNSLGPVEVNQEGFLCSHMYKFISRPLNTKLWCKISHFTYKLVQVGVFYILTDFKVMPR